MSKEKNQKEQSPELRDDFVDISSCSSSYNGFRYQGNHAAEGSRGKGVKILIITLVSVAVIAAIGTVGFVMFNGVKTEPTVPTTKATETTEFTFASNSVISGLDISGKTMEQAKKRLMTMLHEEDETLIPTDVRLTEPYRNEQDAMHVLYALGNLYEPVRLFRHLRRKKKADEPDGNRETPS